ncbi:MAG TPA: monovalent cation/H(+) antiporter subunit G [Rhodopila sp.]
MTATLLLLAVAFTWLGCFGFARFASPYDRLHCVTFVGVTAGLFIAAAACGADGLSDRALKAVLFLLATLVNGAAVSHATARAIMRRGPGVMK